MPRSGIALTLPPNSSQGERAVFLQLCEQLALLEDGAGLSSDRKQLVEALLPQELHSLPYLAAAAHAVLDLIAQGWIVRVDGSTPSLIAPDAIVDRHSEKQRIQNQELVRRQAQLSQPSVRRFILRMEQPRSHGANLVSIFSLMRDGTEMLEALSASHRTNRPAIDPYVQIVDDSRCDQTGLKLQDIWRYFRHTWSNAYSTVPGRSMAILIRDRATTHHAVIGLAALSSPVVQIAERDKWIGWDSEGVMEEIVERPTLQLANWLTRRLDGAAEEIYTEDLLCDAVIGVDELSVPTFDAIERLKADSERFRSRHHDNAQLRSLRTIAPDDWLTKAKTDLFRGKRSAALADALEAKLVLTPFFRSDDPLAGLVAAAADSRGRRQLRSLVRRARGERVGTIIADLTVCGAIAPYNALAAGKLVGALAVSPKVLQAYHAKYERPSQIASSMAGRPIIRDSRLAFVGTTSLYSTGSSQYNRLFWPATAMGGDPSATIGFVPIGRSQSFGTSHFSDDTISSFVRLSALEGSGVRVNGLFGEGVSPRLRKVRLGLTVLGWPANDLMKHGRQRLVYGVPLVDNLRDFSLGIDMSPVWLMDVSAQHSDQTVGEWWRQRWCSQRAQRPQVIEQIARQTMARPITHGARVALPPAEDH